MADYTPEPSDEWPERFVSSVNAYADLFGVAAETARTWKRVPGFPAKTAKGYDLLAIIRHRYRYIVDQMRKGLREDADEGGVEGTTKTEQETIKLMLANQKAHLELRAAAGELIEVEEASAQQQYVYNAVRQRLEALPGELASSIAPEQRPDFVADAKNKIRLCLKQMEGWATANDSTPSPKPEA